MTSLCFYIYFCFQDEKNQIMTTNVWVEQVRTPYTQTHTKRLFYQITYNIKPDELYIHSCEKNEAEGRGQFHS